MIADHQILPANGPLREALREKGQFWTPDWVARAMVAYVLNDKTKSIFDPAVGAGAFFGAAKSLAVSMGRQVELRGTELHPDSLVEARSNGLSAQDLAGVEIRDFVLNPPPERFEAIVGNPPYIRHHRLSKDVKAKLRTMAITLLGKPIDGRAGYHVFFLLRALERLEKNGRLSFIMPADTCEGIFAQTLWRWIARKYRLMAVVTFSPNASPFPRVDTNVVIFMIENSPPQDWLHWVHCTYSGDESLTHWVQSGFCSEGVVGMRAIRRNLDEMLSTGLSREPTEIMPGCPTLGDFSYVLRGIATGCNEFFFLTRAQAKNLNIPLDYFIPAIGRTKDVLSDSVEKHDLNRLDADGRPTLLLSLDARPMRLFPKSLQDYLAKGESQGLPNRPLIASRNPWYKMEVRKPPPFLFAYLGRRNVRFIRNHARIVPLTGFLCVYSRIEGPEFEEKLWRVLSDPDTLANLKMVGKSYGQGAIKVEPRALEKLLVSVTVEKLCCLGTVRPKLQLSFF